MASHLAGKNVIAPLRSTSNHGTATFARREGTSSQHGVAFQYQVAALLLARALARDAGARVGAEHAHAGAFDDVSVRMRPAPGRPPVLLLLQLKHKSGDAPRLSSQALRGDSGSFAVRKYFRSYIHDVDVQRLGAAPGSTFYVLFTNAALPESQLQAAGAGAVPRAAARLLHTGCGGGQPRLLAPDADHLAGEGRGPEFLARFLWLGAQASDAELLELLRQELMQHFRRVPRDAARRARELVRAVEEWYEDTGDVSYLTADWAPWRRLVQDDPPLLRALRFADAEMLRLMETVTDAPTGGVLLLACDTADEEVRGAKMAQMASLRPLLLARLQGTADASDAAVVLSLWERGWCRELAVLLSGGSSGKTKKADAKEVATLGERLLAALAIDMPPTRPDDVRGRALVLLAPPLERGEAEHPLATWLRVRLEPRGRWAKGSDSVAFRQLARDAREAVLRHPAALQGRACAVADLRQEHVLDAVLCGDALAHLLRSREPLRLGVAPEEPTGDDPYIPRRLQKIVPVRAEVFRAGGAEDVFLVKEASKEELEALAPPRTRVDLLDRHNASSRFVVCRKMSWARFREFSQQFPGRRCHFLKKVDGDFTWRQSSGCGDAHDNLVVRYLDAEGEELRNNATFVARCQSCTPFEDDLAEAGVRVVLVSGDPGAGKSATLARVARTLAQRHPHDWVLHLCLADCTSALEAAEGDCASGAAEALLRSAAGLAGHGADSAGAHDALAEALLRDRLWESGGVRVLVDAFDEISPDYTEAVVSILKALQNSCVTSLWVSSRQVMEDRLEAELRVRSFALKPLSVADQELFWVSYWAGPLRSRLPRDQLERRARALLKSLGSRFRSQFRLNIPLHTAIMATVWGKEFLEDKIEDSPRLQDVLYMYRKFVEMKFDIYCREKANIIANNVLMKNLLSALHKDFMEKHKMCALLESGVFEFLKPKTRTEICRKTDSFLSDIQKGVEKTGIIVGVASGKPRFLHRTFAEYFTGKWIAENHSDNPGILDVLMRGEFKFVKSVADLLMSQTHVLHEAVLNDDVKKLKEILSHGSAEVNALDGGGRSALVLALQKDTREGYTMSRYLLENGASLNENHELYCAVQSQAWDNVKLLLREGVMLKNSVLHNVHVQEIFHKAFRQKLITEEDRTIPNFELNWNIFSKGRSILHIAIQTGEKENVKALLHMKADARSKDSQSNTPLHYAVQCQDEDMVGILLSAGAFVHPKNLLGETPLFLACSKGLVSAASQLLKRGAAPNSRSKTGSSLLHAAIDHPAVTELLLKQNCDLDAMDSRGYTALHEATRKKNSWLVNRLVSRGANVNCSNFQSLTPLLIAVNGGCLDTAEILLKANANVMSCTSRGDTPLHIAVLKKNVEMVNLLLNYRADPCAENNKGESPLSLSSALGVSGLETLLFSKAQLSRSNSYIVEQDVQVKHVAQEKCIPAPKSYWGDEDELDGMIPRQTSSTTTKAEPNFSAPALSPASPTAIALLAAVKRRNLQDLRRLAATAFKDPGDWGAADGSGDTALHAAARAWTAEAVGVLATRAPPAALDARNACGDAPLHVAAARRDHNVSLTLLAAGADLAAEDARGDTPLHVACRRAVYPQVRYVTPRAPPAVLQARNGAGDTPLHLALALGDCKEEGQLAQPPPGAARAQLLICYDSKDVVTRWEAEGCAEGRSSRPSSRAQLAKTVLAATPAPALRAANERGDTPLHVAARGRALRMGPHVARSTWGAEMFRLLLERGADVAAVNNEGDTVLHLACRNPCETAAMTTLLESKMAAAAAVAANSRGSTSLHEAAEHCDSVSVCRALVALGADPGSRDAEGRTPLSLAKRAGKAAVVSYFQETLNTPSHAVMSDDAFQQWSALRHNLPQYSFTMYPPHGLMPRSGNTNVGGRLPYPEMGHEWYMPRPDIADANGSQPMGHSYGDDDADYYYYVRNQF